MENNFDNQFANDIAPLPQKPQFLKVLCILSFIACGLMIIFCLIGAAIGFAIGEETRNDMWNMILQTQPQLESTDPQEFFHALGMSSIYSLIANIVSLVGVILMWRLNKLGFFIYAVAELSVHFFGINVGGEGSSSVGSMIFWILMDVAFIIMYAVNLKHMTKKAEA
jgi:hypothetical protein